MREARFRRKLLAWGNGFGIRVTKADAERLGLHAGQEIDVHIAPASDEVDLSHLAFFDDGPDVSVRHDEELRRALDAGR